MSEDNAIEAVAKEISVNGEFEAVKETVKNGSSIAENDANQTAKSLAIDETSNRKSKDKSDIAQLKHLSKNDTEIIAEEINNMVKGICEGDNHSKEVSDNREEDKIIADHSKSNYDIVEIAEEEAMETTNDDDVQEVKEDSDSDIMEVDQEDPCDSKSVSDESSKTSALISTEVKKPPPVVTIDDTKTFQASDSSTAKPKATAERDKVTINDETSTKTLTGSSEAIPGSNVSKGQPQDPNLMDDTTVVIEAPSFIVPYVYEKPPREPFQAFKEDIKKMMEEMKVKLEEDGSSGQAKLDENKGEDPEDKPIAKRKKRNTEEDNDSDFNASGAEESDSENDDDDDIDIVEMSRNNEAKSLHEFPDLKKPSSDYFESTLGKMVSGLGLNLVQEHVQHDLLKQQQRKAHKDKRSSTMHAILALKQNLEQSKEKNAIFNWELKKCRSCSFKTESDCTLENHLEMPHIRKSLYHCNFCNYKTKGAQEVLDHMQDVHNVKLGHLERVPFQHQCPQCPFEDTMKGKLTRHKVGCDKRFKPEMNQQPPYDFEPPAKIISNRPKIQIIQKLDNNNQSKLNSDFQFGPNAQRSGTNFSKPAFILPKQPVERRQIILPKIGRGAMEKLGGNESATVQTITKTTRIIKVNPNNPNNPMISILPPVSKGNPGKSSGAPSSSSLAAPKPEKKDSFVICEICDGFIKDLEQLRNHMSWIHKVKIHPKMIYNRPPLNCQKCQFRFFTDQGLERHLLGTHGLVTAGMQALANRGKDSGKCAVCGKTFHWKLLNHVAIDHMKTLKPANLSYRCTVCKATFDQYKLFENHVFSSHSKDGPKHPKQIRIVAGGAINVSDEITIIPHGQNQNNNANKAMPVLPKVIPVPNAQNVKSNNLDIIEIEIDGDDEN